MKSYATGREKNLAALVASAACLLASLHVSCIRLDTPEDKAVTSTDDIAVEKNSPIQLEVLSAGLAGYIPASGKAFVIRYRISNAGPACRANLSLYHNASSAYPNQDIPLMTRLGLADKSEALPAMGKVEGEWIIAQTNWGYAAEFPGNSYLVATSDKGGRALAAARVFGDRSGGTPLIILASDKEQALSVEKAIRTVLPDDQASYIPVASVYTRLPNAWFEYEAANQVLLARPVSSLNTLEKEALYKWVSLGGRLLVATEYATDWTDDDTKVFNHGVGSARVLPALSSCNHKTFLNQEQETPLPSMLTTGYQLPDFRLFVGAVILIILLVGPVLHIVLAKLHRREWIWVAAPLLSAAAAVGMYGLAQAVKGDKSAVEIHHFFVGGDKKAPFLSVTAARLQSAQKGDVDLKVETDEPTPSPTFDPYQYRQLPQTLLTVERGSVFYAKLFMQKWSTRDIIVESVGAPYPVERVLSSNDTVGIRNLSPRPLSELYYLRNLSWFRLKGDIKGGEERRFSLTAELVVNDTGTDPADQSLPDILQPALYGVRTNFPDKEILFSTCAPSRVPKVWMNPAPKVVRESSHCVFLFPITANDTAPPAVPFSGAVPLKEEVSP